MKNEKPLKLIIPRIPSRIYHLVSRLDQTDLSELYQEILEYQLQLDDLKAFVERLQTISE